MASRKTDHDKVFYFGAKGPFTPKKWWHHEKHYNPKSVLYWYQCFSV